MQGYADSTLGTTSRVRTRRRPAVGHGQQPRHLAALLETAAFVLDHRIADRRLTSSVDRAGDSRLASSVDRAGDRRLASSVDRAGDPRFAPDHDRRAEGAHEGALAPIDHVAVGASGVWVIASRRVPVERISLRRSFVAPPRLRVGSTDRTTILTMLDHQRSAISAALAVQPHVPIHTAACFIGGQFPLLGSLSAAGHLIVPPTDLIAHVSASGPLRRSEARRIAELLDRRLG